ncbi:MAG: hypothetical protein VX577_10400 [Verrucomicrobiota bacterium]|nr:hypothetical protein [Verrucomicrobiota bacterium]
MDVADAVPFFYWDDPNAFPDRVRPAQGSVRGHFDCLCRTVLCSPETDSDRFVTIDLSRVNFPMSLITCDCFSWGFTEFFSVN